MMKGLVMTSMMIQPPDGNHPRVNIIAVGGLPRSGKGEVINDIQALLGKGWHVASKQDLLVLETASLLSYWVGHPIDPEMLDINRSGTRGLFKHIESKIEDIEPARLIKSVFYKARLGGNVNIIVDSITRASEVKFFSKLRAQLVLVEPYQRIQQEPDESVQALKRYRNTYIIKNDTTKRELADEVLRFVEYYCRLHGPF